MALERILVATLACGGIIVGVLLFHCPNIPLIVSLLLMLLIMVACGAWISHEYIPSPGSLPTANIGSVFQGAELRLNASVYTAALTEEQAGTAGAYVLTVGFNRSLTSSDKIIFVTITPDQKANFAYIQNPDGSIVLRTRQELSPGEYTFDLFVILSHNDVVSPQVKTPVVVRVISTGTVNVCP